MRRSRRAKSRATQKDGGGPALKYTARLSNRLPNAKSMSEPHESFDQLASDFDP